MAAPQLSRLNSRMVTCIAVLLARFCRFFDNFLNMMPERPVSGGCWPSLRKYSAPLDLPVTGTLMLQSKGTQQGQL
jgi:hypothetical protein